MVGWNIMGRSIVLRRNEVLSKTGLLGSHCAKNKKTHISAHHTKRTVQVV